MKLLVVMSILAAGSVHAAESVITGNVQSKCVITTETAGVYGNPTADKLSTAPADGGVKPIIRYDVSMAGYYAQITTPTTFSTSPSLNDTLAWSGSVAVKEVSDAAMASIETNKIEFGETTQFDIDKAGSLWFEVDSSVTYGYGRALPGGTYRAVVQAECIAQ